VLGHELAFVPRRTAFTLEDALADREAQFAQVPRNRTSTGAGTGAGAAARAGAGEAAGAIARSE
jgi:hypothetical protein